jgi:extracellular factor (EF) 3-hydroxypalmitic acid methyl ester biosynthesis protein
MATAIQISPLGSFSRGDAASDQSIHRLLDHTADCLRALDTSTLDDFVYFLNEARLDRSPNAWNSLIANIIAPHGIRSLIHEDPFTRRAFEKPRGYPGDAPLLDLIYRDRPFDGEMTPRGARIHEWTSTSPACLSVCARRARLASLIDRVARETARPRILAVACGHLREAKVSRAVPAGEVGEIVALDQDQESLDLVEREKGNAYVTPIRASIRRLLVEPTAYGEFDLVYAAGLFDYLQDEVARRLTSSIFAALRPGGRMLVANFAPSLRDIGYMEAIMDWRLIYRDDGAVEQLADRLPRERVCEQTVSRDNHGNVVYLAARKY